MKNRSFLFLIAALAMGLALFGCSSDSDDGGGYPVPGPKEGYLYNSDATKIMVAFQDAPAVYLEEDTVLSGGVLIIPSGKALHVNGQTITVDKDTVIVVHGTLDWDGKASSVIEGGGAVVIGKSYEAGRYSAGEYDADDNPGGVVFGEIGRYVGSASTVWHIAASTGSALTAGTTGYFLGNINTSDGLSITAGTLFVGGNLTVGKAIISEAPLTIYGKLTGGTDASQTLITGTVSAISAAISGGKIANDLTIFRDGVFATNKVTFEGILDVKRDATFNSDVKFEKTGTIARQAVFADGIEVTGKAEVGNLGISGNGASKALVLATDGQIIFTKGINPGGAFFPTNIGTLATLANPVTFAFNTNELAVSGAGSFVVGDKISVTGSNQIKVDGTTGVYFNNAGTIIAESYELGREVGTLSTANTANGGFILTKDGIKNAVDTGNASLTYALADGAAKAFLIVKEDSTVTLTGVNINVSAGSIAFGGSATLHLATGGSITTGNETYPAGSLAYSGYIVTTKDAGGSIVAGSIGSMSAASITGGSVGTTTSNAIHKNSFFAIAGDGDDGSASAAAEIGSASASKVENLGGSIAVFKNN
jgi:hypothetical protein